MRRSRGRQGGYLDLYKSSIDVLPLSGTGSDVTASAGKGSDAPTGRGRFPASSSQSGICAAVSAQSGTIIGAGAALDCKGGVPLLCAPALQFQSGTRIPVMPLWGARAECGEGNCRSYY